MGFAFKDSKEGRVKSERKDNFPFGNMEPMRVMAI